MKVWAYLLRTVGAIFFAHTVIDLIMNLLRYIGYNLYSLWTTVTLVSRPALEGFSFTFLCFGGASVLLSLRQTNQRLAQLGARRSATAKAAPKDLAPEPPTWSDFPNPVHRSSMSSRKDTMTEVLRLANSVEADDLLPSLREAPPPIRITPGTEDQYRDTTEPRVRGVPNPYLRNRQPIHLPEDRELLRGARDRNLRRKFMDE